MYAKKSLGQNFLMHARIAERIALVAHLTGDDVVLEIGPGTGMLTRELLKLAEKVVAIEADDELFEKLKIDFEDEIADGRLELIHGDIRSYPLNTAIAGNSGYHVEWIITDPPREELRARIDVRLKSALERGLVEEVRRVREVVGDIRLNELGLEYKIVGEYLRNEVSNTRCLTLEAALLPVLSAKLWQYARRQKAWLRKLGHLMS